MTPDDLAPWDPLWTDAPRRWGEGPWSGNGTLGALAYVHPAHPDRLRIETGHAAACMARLSMTKERFAERGPGRNTASCRSRYA